MQCRICKKQLNINTSKKEFKEIFTLAKLVNVEKLPQIEQELIKGNLCVKCYKDLVQ